MPDKKRPVRLATGSGNNDRDLRPPGPAPLEAEPTNPFEIMIAERLQALRRDVDRLQTRLDWLFALIIGAAVTNVVLALLR
jgi:hypothetical protein